jgi:hypothetical protein
MLALLVMSGATRADNIGQSIALVTSNGAHPDMFRATSTATPFQHILMELCHSFGLDFWAEQDVAAVLAVLVRDYGLDLTRRDARGRLPLAFRGPVPDEVQQLVAVFVRCGMPVVNVDGNGSTLLHALTASLAMAPTSMVLLQLVQSCLDRQLKFTDANRFEKTCFDFALANAPSSLELQELVIQLNLLLLVEFDFLTELDCDALFRATHFTPEVSSDVHVEDLVTMHM